MLKNLSEIIQKRRPVIIDKVRVGVSYIKVPITPDQIITKETDVKGNDILYILLNSVRHEIIGVSKDEKYYYVRVNKKEFPKSYPRSVPYFVFPEGSPMEKIYGRRATKIKIVLLDNEFEKLIPNQNEKYEGGQLACWGDNETATRREDDGTTTSMKCPCAYHVDFKEELLSEIPLNEIEGSRYNKHDSTKKEVLVQGAWRGCKSFDKEHNIIQLDPLEPSCDIRFRFRFVMPEMEGINVYMFEGGGDGNLATLVNNITDLMSVFGHVRGIPLYLCVRMAERNIKNIGVRKFPEVWLHLPYSVDKMLDIQAKELMSVPSDAPQLPEGEEADFSVANDVE